MWKNPDKIFSIVLIVTSLLLFGSCASVPSKTIWRPFTAVMKSNTEINPGTKLQIQIIGETLPLLGSDDLRLDSLKTIIIDLLERRGFEIVESNYDFKVSLIYKTERISKMQMTSYSYEANKTGIKLSSTSGTISRGGLGVSIAIALSNIYSYSQSTKSLKIADESCFLHTISAEFRDTKDILSWKGESYWESSNVQIFNILASAMQYILCNLPADDSILPWTNEVKADHAENFFSLFCENKTFICPALPFSISFKSYENQNQEKTPATIRNPEALSAYIDLITTAEYAVPMGKFNSKNVLEEDLWEKVQLGHQYLIGPKKNKINILINLVGKSNGYLISKCWVASDDEYLEYQRRFLNWKIALNEYYNLYVN